MFSDKYIFFYLMLSAKHLLVICNVYLNACIASAHDTSYTEIDLSTKDFWNYIIVIFLYVSMESISKRQ